MGSDPIALPALEWLAGEGRAVAELVAVYTRPDRPHGRGQRVEPNAIKRWALARGLPVRQPERLDEAARAEFAASRPDAALVMAYGHILRQDWIDTPRFSIWNLHASLLPAFRGASPIQGAIVAGAAESGVCLMRIVRALDAGPVLDRERVVLDPLETAGSLEERLARCCVPLLRRSLGRALQPAPPAVGQEHARATFTRRLFREDGRLDFAAAADVLARRINGLFPWPGTFFELQGETIKVGLAAPGAQAAKDIAPGTVLAPGADALVVATGGGGSVRLLRLQRPGGRMLEAGDFLRGRPIAPGTRIESGPMPELVAARPFTG